MTGVQEHFWVRAEARSTERRTPLVPDDVGKLIAAGHSVTVEDSPMRVIDSEAYARAGATIVAAGTWAEAPSEAIIVGIKELPEEPRELSGTHVYFAHAFKGQSDAADTLGRFRAGGGRLLDIEYLRNENGKRTVAFGYWAGYVGAALGVLHLMGSLKAPLGPTDRPTLDAALIEAGAAGANTALAVVTGARGRSGRGAQRALLTADMPTAGWDRTETRDLHKQALLGHDLLVNCVFSTEPTAPFVSANDLHTQRRLRVISDVTCDVTGPANMLPINTAITTWDEPVRAIDTGHSDLAAEPLDIIAIDNLPSLLPLEASTTFSADLTAELLQLDTTQLSGAWASADSAFRDALSSWEV